MTTLVRQDYLDDAAAWRTYHLRQAVINADNAVTKAATAIMQAGIDEIEKAYVAYEVKRRELIQAKEMEADYHAGSALDRLTVIKRAAMITLCTRSMFDNDAAWRMYHLRQAVINAENALQETASAFMQAGADEARENHIAYEVRRKELIQVKEMEADYHKRMQEIIGPPLIPVRQDTGD